MKRAKSLLGGLLLASAFATGCTIYTGSDPPDRPDARGCDGGLPIDAPIDASGWPIDAPIDASGWPIDAAVTDASVDAPPCCIPGLDAGLP